VKEIGIPVLAKPAAVEARIEIDRMIAVLTDYNRPFAAAVQAVTRICEMPMDSPETFALVRDGMRRAANDLRGSLSQRRNAVRVAEGLLELERTIQKSIEKKRNQ
jgi:hypothetical protein